MKTNILIGGALVIAVAAGLWLTFGSDKAEAPANNAAGGTAVETEVQSSGTAKIDETFAGTGSFIDLMGLGQNLKCDFSYLAEDTNGAVAGTVYVSGERLRGDFEMQQAGEVYVSHMINANDMLYTWSETPEGTFAMKFPATESEDTAAAVSAPADYNRSVDLDSDVEYDCRAWSIDGSVFVPPANIEFQDMEQMMETMMQGFRPSVTTQ